MENKSHKISFLWVKRIIISVAISRPIAWLINKIYRGRIPFRGNVVEIPKVVDNAIAARLFWGFYEATEVRYVQSKIKPEHNVIELGASIGGVSCAILNMLNPDRTLVCVEANPYIIDNLRANLSNNCRSGAKYEIVNAAIGNVGQDKISFFTDTNSLESKDANGGLGVEVSTIALSDLLAMKGFDEFALVCDIEGAEYALFNHQASALAKCVLLIIELHNVKTDTGMVTPDKIIKLIESNTHLRVTDRRGDVCVFA